MVVGLSFIFGEEDAHLALLGEEFRVDIPAQSQLLASLVHWLEGRGKAKRLIDWYDTNGRHEGIIEGSMVLLHRRLNIGSIAYREEELVFTSWNLIGVGDDGRGSAVHDPEVQTWATLRWACWEVGFLRGGEVRLIARIIQLFLLSVSGRNSNREVSLLGDDVE